MSVVTNVIVTYPVWGPPVDVFDSWLRGNGHGPFLDVGGENLLRSEKTFEATVLVGAFNYLRTDALMSFLRQVDWEQEAGICSAVRPNVRVGVQEEDEQAFRFFSLEADK